MLFALQWLRATLVEAVVPVLFLCCIAVLPVEFLTCICSLCALYGGGGSGGSGAHKCTERERAKEIVNLHIKYF